MVWMATYCFYCSVRLGVIVVAVFTMIQIIIPSTVFLAYGNRIFESIANLIAKDDDIKENKILRKLQNWYSDDPIRFMLLLDMLFSVHLIFCCLAIFGAVKTLKWFLLPFIFTEFFRVIIMLVVHIILMIILEKSINLGVLILFTVFGGYAVLFLAYNWVTVVAFFQIIILINSQSYKTLYGDNPFKPISNDKIQTSFLLPDVHRRIEYIKISTSPNDIKFNAKKKTLNDYDKWNKGKIISVKPFEGDKRVNNEQFANWHWTELAYGRNLKNKNIVGQKS